MCSSTRLLHTSRYTCAQYQHCPPISIFFPTETVGSFGPWTTAFIYWPFTTPSSTIWVPSHRLSRAQFLVDRESVVGKMEVDTTEYQFKIALMKHRKKVSLPPLLTSDCQWLTQDVMSLMQSKKLVGQSIISYLHQKGSLMTDVNLCCCQGHPELALHFVQDDQAKFNLALECGDVATALECAGKVVDTFLCRDMVSLVGQRGKLA